MELAKQPQCSCLLVSVELHRTVSLVETVQTEYETKTCTAHAQQFMLFILCEQLPRGTCFLCDVLLLHISVFEQVFIHRVEELPTLMDLI